MGFNPQLPNKYLGTDKTITFFVTRSRSPTGADYRQPETGRNYPLGTIWQTGKNPTTGTEGDLWSLSKIVSNVAYWIQFGSGVSPSGPLLSLSDTADTLVYPSTVSPVGNIQLKSTTGNLTITSIPVSHEIDFNVTSGVFFETFTVDAISAPGVNPVTPNGSGDVVFHGDVVAQSGVPFQTISRALNTMAVEVQIADESASTDATKNGICHFDSAHFSVDANGFVTGNFATDDLHWPLFIVGDVNNGANYSTIAAAIAASSAGDTIAIQPGTYTENISLTSGRNFVGLSQKEQETTLLGKYDDGGNTLNAYFERLTLRTNSDYFLSFTGASSGAVFSNCNLRCTNNTGVNLGAAGATAQYFFTKGNVETTGISYYTGSGVHQFFQCTLLNSGSSTTASDSSGSVTFVNTTITVPITVSSAASITARGSNFDTSVTNTVAITTAGTGSSQIYNSVLQSGSAASISVGAGTIVFAANNVVRSTATNVFTGAGTINTGGNVCTSSSGNDVSVSNNLTTI